MITNKEYESLYELLNAKEESLERLYERFAKTWGAESANVFRPCFSLANFLSLNVSNQQWQLLTKLQRIVAMFLLLEAFKVEGIRKNPFAGILFEVYDKTTEPYERKFLCELLLDNKRDRYAKLKIDVINEEYEQMQEPYKSRDEMEALRKGFIENVPKVTASKQNEVRNIVPDFNLKERRTLPLDQPVNKDSIKESELACEAFSSNFLLPIPKFIEIQPSQLQWLGPGIIYDVTWDSTYEKERKHARVKQLLTKCETTPLTLDESRELTKLSEDHPYLIEAELKVTAIEGITSTNPSVALELLTCTYDSPRFQSIVEKLINMRVNRNTISIVGKFFLKFDVPKVLVCYYISRMIQQCVVTDPNVERTVGLVVSFTEMCLRNKMLDLKMIEQYIREFALRFPKNDRLTLLCKAIEEGEH